MREYHTLKSAELAIKTLRIMQDSDITIEDYMFYQARIVDYQDIYKGVKKSCDGIKRYFESK
jgi:hypothetical protein